MKVCGICVLYCKEDCYPNITSSIKLPYSEVHDFRQGPILMSFQIERHELEGWLDFSNIIIVYN